MSGYLKNIKNIIIIITISKLIFAQDFSIARVHYDGGGDWYGDPSSIPNLLNFIKKNTSIAINLEEKKIRLTDSDLYYYPFLYITGHGNIRFSEDEVGILRKYLKKGGFLHADDNYGMDKSFRREMKRVFPEKDWVELSYDHEIFHTFYEFPNGLPKIHEHDGQPAQAFGLFEGERLIVLYTYESDLGDGWEDIVVHKDPQYLHESALKMGVNIIWFALTQ
jgi:hypothetical protein